MKGIDELLQDSDSDDDDDDTASKRSNRSKRGAKNSSSSAAAARKDKAWLQEGNDGDIVDFLDPSVSKKVLGEHFREFIKRTYVLLRNLLADF